MSEKRRLPQPVILSRTRYIGFSREPVRDDRDDNLISGLPAPRSDYELRDGNRWLDMRKAKS